MESDPRDYQFGLNHIKIGAGLRIDCLSSDLGVDTVETWEAPAHTHAIGCWTVITITCKLFCKRNSPGLYMVLMHAQLNCLIQDDVDNEMEHSNPSEEIHCAIPSIRIYRAMGEQISVVYGAGHLVTATFGQWPIWSDEVKFFQKDFV
jgi:hypothetical protein